MIHTVVWGEVYAFSMLFKDSITKTSLMQIKNNETHSFSYPTCFKNVSLLYRKYCCLLKKCGFEMVVRENIKEATVKI